MEIPNDQPTKTKKVLAEGKVVGEIEASDDPQVEVERSVTLLKSLGLWRESPIELRMFNHAAAFSHAASYVYSSSLRGRSNVNRGAAPFVVNATFALEIYIKTLAKLHGLDLTGHKVQILFGALPSKLQLDISEQYSEKARARGVSISASLASLLEGLNDAFVKWRYLYEFEKTDVFHIEETIAIMETFHTHIAKLINK